MVLAGSHCYMFGQNRQVLHDQARRICARHGAQLASADDPNRDALVTWIKR